MLIDCDRCTVRGAACSGCVVNALLTAPEGLAGLTGAELRAIEALDMAGLDVEVLSAPPPPRMVPIARRRRDVA
ncbi:hypothetical protein [Spirilliplanes yamanashiensis]|uniref:Uncharacterized protein n=1 Tax=Spirilliplanes yamanashiensis TaxID=42233 RepID=A0A8J3Y901_9ACTN|nr:hypothetical protein [Spirilliplanes yamanashiensis]MDP9816862.1 hypothetical protein [Spirilliplanes yamanashiensis]GIJ03482.1 hypothetical protein Sya03_28340 [Spirilliplanes yamanashiensis]